MTTETTIPQKKRVIKTNWKEIEKAIKKESQAEDCMIPMRERIY